MTEGLILGHFISAAGIQVDPAKIQILLLIPTPTTQTEVRSFLAFSGYYRRFIEHYSHIAAPLYALTGNVDFMWTEKCDRAFQDLKKLVSTAPVLRGPNWSYRSKSHQMPQIQQSVQSLGRKRIKNHMLFIISAKIYPLLN